MLYRLAARLPARFHGIHVKSTTAQLFRLSEAYAVQYSEALQACLEGKRRVGAHELNEPLMMWNAIWKVLGRRLMVSVDKELRRKIMKRNMEMLEHPVDTNLWAIVECWMQAREQESEIRDELFGPVSFREHDLEGWKTLDPRQDLD